MEIGIISDTHLRQTAKIEPIYDKFLKGLDLVIHAGDYIDRTVLDFFQAHQNFVGVWGNNDGDEIRSLLNPTEVVPVAGHRIGVCHGHPGSPGGGPANTFERAYYLLGSETDIIIFGHSHQPLLRTKNKVLLLNPGSLMSKRRERRASLIRLALYPNHIEPRFIFFDS